MWQPLSGFQQACREAATPYENSRTRSEDEISQLKAAFNAADRVPRLMVFFTEGCAACVEAARSVRQILEQAQPAPVLIIVWESVPSSGLPAAAPTSKELALLNSTSVRQVWDPNHLLSRALYDTHRAHPDGPAQASLRTDKREDGVLYDTVVLFAPGTRWEQTLPSPAYLDGGVSAVLPETRKRLGAYR
jgi:hypothetical protein